MYVPEEDLLEASLSLTVYVDGSYKKDMSRKAVGWGVVIYDALGNIMGQAHGGEEMLALSVTSGSTHAESLAIKKALNLIYDAGWNMRRIVIRHDSTSASAISGPHRRHVFPNLTFEQIPRRENKVADDLSRQARLELA